VTWLDGRPPSQAIRAETAERAARLRSRGVAPCLAAVLVGDDPASQIYVGSKERACARAGIDSRVLRLPASTTMAQLRDVLDGLAADPAVHGILVQQPLPPQLDTSEVVASVPPAKDVDGLHPWNAGRLARGESGLVPCTPLGVVALLEHYGVPIAGRHVVIVGRSNLVGRPLSLLLLRRDATVTVCHSRTQDLAAVCRSADILVAAVGRPGLITADMARPGAVVVDVGINRTADGVVGDVHPAVAEVAAAISPVPGGVGLLTVAMLLRNTVEAAAACC
jgi:methylenetetrahydrofolate dehydrogenase (NADP+)/methenyltetrahydrofolate cyclohydrolase